MSLCYQNIVNYGFENASEGLKERLGSFLSNFGSRQYSWSGNPVHPETLAYACPAYHISVQQAERMRCSAGEVQQVVETLTPIMQDLHAGRDIHTLPDHAIKTLRASAISVCR